MLPSLDEADLVAPSEQMHRPVSRFAGTVLVAEDGKSSVSCKRYCPHQGADLKYAKFDGRYVICPRHQWRFDCADGGKADNSADTLSAEIIPVKKENNG